MLKIRFKRVGKKRQPTYRIVMMESTAGRDSNAIKELGFYNPISKEVKLDVPTIVKYLKLGAQPTETVKNLLRKANVFE